MSRYGVKPELLDSVAESFLALENSTDHSSGSEKEEMKEEVYEFLKDYKEKMEAKSKQEEEKLQEDERVRQEKE